MGWWLATRTVRREAWILATLAALGLAAGCGSGDDTVADAAPDGAADAAGPDAWAPMDAAQAPPVHAFLSVERWSRAGVIHTMAAAVMFNQTSALPRLAWVSPQCAYHEGLWAGTSWPSFGSLRLSGTSEGEVSLWPDGYESPPARSPGWNSGDVMTVTATGDSLPRFQLSGTVPAAPTLTSHDMTQPGPGQIAVHRNEPFPISWTPVAGEVFALILELDNDGLPFHGVQCFFPGMAGAGTLPVAALTHLRPQSEVNHTNFYFSSVVRDRVALAGADVDLAVWNGSATRVEVTP